MNTVAAIVADPELPEDHELVQSIVRKMEDGWMDK